MHAERFNNIGIR